MAWRGEQAGWQAARLGHQVVMAPQQWTYLDWAQDDSPAEPLAIRAGSSLRHVHGYDPVPPDRSPQERSAVLGAQCQLWTEYVPDTSHAEYMYFPRLCAFADRAWSAQAGDFGEFSGRLAGHLPRLDALGVNYRPLSGPTPGQARRWPEPADAG
jgi:hexosaminidase